MLEDLDALRMASALDRIVRIFASAPRFMASRSGELMSPPGYASVAEENLTGRRFMAIPDEFRLD